VTGLRPSSTSAGGGMSAYDVRKALAAGHDRT
jgi:hypothetical protein